MPIVSAVTFDCEFGSGEQTYRDPRLFLRGKAARGCAIETGCDKGLPNLGWARCNGMQAVITHGIFSWDSLHWSSHLREGTAEMARDTLTDVKIIGRFRVGCDRGRHRCREGRLNLAIGTPRRAKRVMMWI